MDHRRETAVGRSFFFRRSFINVRLWHLAEASAQYPVSRGQRTSRLNSNTSAEFPECWPKHPLIIFFLSRPPGTRGGILAAGRLLRRSVHPFRCTAFIDPSCNGFLAWVVRPFFGLVDHGSTQGITLDPSHDARQGETVSNVNWRCARNSSSAPTSCPIGNEHPWASKPHTAPSG
jgi:hypothetical protein